MEQRTLGREIDGTTRSSLGGEREREMDGTINPVQAKNEEKLEEERKTQRKEERVEESGKESTIFSIFRFL